MWYLLYVRDAPSCPHVDINFLSLELFQSYLLNFEGKEYTVGNGGIGEVTQKLYDELTAIQWGKRPDPFGWVDPVC